MRIINRLSAAFIGCAMMGIIGGTAAAQVEMQTGSQNKYTVLLNTESQTNVFAFFVPQDVESEKVSDEAPEVTRVNLSFYTLLAENLDGKRVVCTGLRARFREGVTLHFATGEVEALKYLTPQGAGHQKKGEGSFGSCREVDSLDNSEINNALVAITTDKERVDASFFIPILGGHDLSGRQTPHNHKMAFDLEMSRNPPCNSAGYNEQHAKAKIGERVTIELCR